MRVWCLETVSMLDTCIVYNDYEIADAWQCYHQPVTDKSLIMTFILTSHSNELEKFDGTAKFVWMFEMAIQDYWMIKERRLCGINYIYN